MQKIKLLFLCFTLSIFAHQSFAQLKGKDLFGDIRARQIGPAVMSGRVADLDVVNSNPNIVYVGAASGGLWKSTTGGVNFRPIFDDYNQSIGAVEIDQERPDTVWVGTGEPWTRNSISIGDGVYKTTDGGKTWKHLGLKDTEHIAEVLIHPENPNVVFVAALGHLWDANEERGLFKTEDGGKTWTKIFYIDENTGCADITINPENPNEMYATMWDFRRTAYSFRSGGKGSGLFKTTDGGKTWNKITKDLPSGILGRMAVEIAPSNPKTVYLTVECEKESEKGLYKSTDAGKSWKLVSTDFDTKVRPFYFSRMVVAPSNENIVYKCGLNLIISEDGGKSFKTVGSNVHSDIHAVWINPENEKHSIIGTDGGAYQSFDAGDTYQMFRDLPISQYYQIAVDNQEPFHVYGGLQDNGSWDGPSQAPGGIQSKNWYFVAGGDGFYTIPHPTDRNIVYAESQGGNIVRHDRRTGQGKDIKPYPTDEKTEFRFNWNTPILVSQHKADRIFTGSQFLFMSDDRGDSWKQISPDLTTNDPNRQKQKQSGGLSTDNSSAENNTTIYAIHESPLDENLLWVGTDDGYLQVSTNLGKTWTNTSPNITGLPKFAWCTKVFASQHDKNTVYATFDNHRAGDMKPYAYKSTDLGKTWTSLVTEDIEGYALSIIEDHKNPNLLFLGTEFGLYISLDAGKTWGRFENNLPKVAVRAMAIQPKADALVLGTHGRGVIIIDDLKVLRQVNESLSSEKFKFLETSDNLIQVGTGSVWFGGAGEFVGENPNNNAKIAYFQSKRHTFGKMKIEVFDQKGNLIQELPAGKRAGINIVNMPLNRPKPKAPPTNNRMALGSAIVGPSLEAGTYKVIITKGKQKFETELVLKNDPKSPYTEADLALQRKTVNQLYDMTEQMAYIHAGFDEVYTQASEKAKANPKMAKKLNTLAEEAKKMRDDLVFLGGDFYVNEDEKLSEKIAQLYGMVSRYPGKPSQSHIDRANVLQREADEWKTKFETFQASQVAKLNAKLQKSEIAEIKVMSFEEFKEKE